MASALDPNREATLRARDTLRRLAVRKVERAPRSLRSIKGWKTRTHDIADDPMMSPAAAARLRANMEQHG